MSLQLCPAADFAAQNQLLFVASAVALCAGSTFSKIVMTLGGGVGLVFVFFGHYYYAAGESVTVIV